MGHACPASVSCRGISCRGLPSAHATRAGGRSCWVRSRVLAPACVACEPQTTGWVNPRRARWSRACWRCCHQHPLPIKQRFMIRAIRTTYESYAHSTPRQSQGPDVVLVVPRFAQGLGEGSVAAPHRAALPQPAGAGRSARAIERARCLPRRHPGTRPQVTLTIVPVMSPADSDARNAAVSATRASAGGRRRVAA